MHEAKKGKDVSRYVDAVERLRLLAPNDADAEIDTVWVETTTKEVTASTEKIELELRGYKNNLIKESIRVWLGLYFSTFTISNEPHRPSTDCYFALLGHFGKRWATKI